jgi:phage terminase large subunit GpA-like protein
MDAYADPAVQKIVLMLAAQLGKTEALILNVIGWHIQHDPCPILVVMPNQSALERLSKKRLTTLFRETESIRSKVSQSKSRSSDSTLFYKAFDGGSVTLATAGSPSQLSSDMYRVILLDEIDRFPISAGSEGNPVDLAIKRASNAWNRKIVLISTPTDEETSRILAAYKHSSQETWHVPCPICDKLQVLSFDRLKFDTLRHECVHCGGQSEQYEWQACSQRGRWIAKNPDHRTRGFHLDCMVSPWIEWSDIKSEFLEANQLMKERDFTSMQVFRNTRLALPWTPSGEKLEADVLWDRREVYEADVPAGVLIITCGTDIQDSGRIVAEVAGWGLHRERWALGYYIFYGSVIEEAVWQELATLLDQEFVRADGVTLKISKMFVDSGASTSTVYHWTRPRQPRAVSIKGKGGSGLPIICNKSQAQDGSNATLITIGSDATKDDVVTRLQTPEPGPAFWHYPKSGSGGPALNYDEEYFRGLCSERRVAAYRNGQRFYSWTKLAHASNEPFDVACYSFAALEFLGGRNALERAAQAIETRIHPPRTVYRPPADPRRYVVKPENAAPPQGFGPVEENSPFGTYRPKSGGGHF